MEMDKEHILLILREHAPELRAAGLLHLRLFGSVARGEASAESDVDLLAEFDRSTPLTLATIGKLETRLTDLLGANVDLSSPDWLKEHVRGKAMEEAVIAF
jgi:predicted nucleotidyltransferase